MASGVKCSDDVLDIYNEMRLVKNDSNQMERVRLVVFEVVGDFIEPSKIFRQKDLKDEENVYKVFVSQMTMDKCCYLLYDCHFTTQDSTKEELVFVMWTPEGSKCKDKMLYASSKQYIKNAMGGVKHMLEFNDASDHEIGSFAEEIGKGITKIESHTFGCTKK